MRRAGDAEAHPAHERDSVSGRAGARRLCEGATCPRDTSLTDDDVYLAIPLQKGQISCRELMRGEVLLQAVKKDEPILIDDIDSPYAQHSFAAQDD